MGADRGAAVIAVVLLGLAVDAHAILTRSDRDDSEYLELASRYVSAVSLAAADGEGVLIAPRWVLTSARVASALRPLGVKARIAFGARDYEVESIFVHSGWKEGEPHDIALVVLREPVAGVAPTPVYRASDEAGQAVVIVGSGQSGRIGAPPKPGEKRDGRKRAAINTVDRVTPSSLGLRVKSADEASDLQGVAGAGERGAPAFIQTADGLFVAGLGHAIEGPDAKAHGVGDWDLYVRVSTYAEWIDATIAEFAAKEAAAILGDPDRR